MNTIKFNKNSINIKIYSKTKKKYARCDIYEKLTDNQKEELKEYVLNHDGNFNTPEELKNKIIKKLYE